MGEINKEKRLPTQEMIAKARREGRLREAEYLESKLEKRPSSPMFVISMPY